MIELAFLVETAIAAGAKILDIYQGDFAVAIKADNSPVTVADTAAEAIILAALAERFPSIPVVAEEATAAGQVPQTGERFFLVDPLDGSKEFISRNGEFTVNIALIESGEPVAGVVYAPALCKIWWGARGAGSLEAAVVDGKPIDPKPISARPANGPLAAIGSRSHGSGEGHPLLARYDIGCFVSAGSSLKFCMIAAGDADLYPRFGRTMEWDTAAGDAILRAAGGHVECLDGSPLRYGKRHQSDESDFANPHFLAFGDPRLSQSAQSN